MVSSPIAWISSGWSSNRLTCSSEELLTMYLSWRISSSERPFRCSRITYSVSIFSFFECVNRNENGLRQMLLPAPMGAILVTTAVRAQLEEPSGSPRPPSPGRFSRPGRRRGRPLQVRVGYRVAVRVVGREAERPVDSRFELLGDDVLEPVGLVVDRVDVQAQRLREVQLDQPVVADHLDGHALAGLGQPSAAVRLVLGE